MGKGQKLYRSSVMKNGKYNQLIINTMDDMKKQ